MGYDSHANIIGIGDIYLWTNVGLHINIEECAICARHAHEFAIYIFFDVTSYESNFSNGGWKHTNGSRVFAREKICYTFYKTHINVYNKVVNTPEVYSSPYLWHKQLAHVSEKGLQSLVKKISHCSRQRYNT